MKPIQLCAVTAFLTVTGSCLSCVAAEQAVPIPPTVNRWFAPQEWVRDVDRPSLTLGAPGAFDDTHLFAPCVALENSRFSLWYSGSRGAVSERVFRLGLATSDDGKQFVKYPANPVFQFNVGKQSVLTATLLRNPDGSLLREAGQLRLWFTTAGVPISKSSHVIYETTSVDGISWSAPRGPQIENAYCPTVIKDGNRYRMWYTDVGSVPWSIRHAESVDGKRWQVTEEPILIIDQEWEKRDKWGGLTYPCVLRIDGTYLMWYGWLWSEHDQKTAIGFAASADGLNWHKHPANPVLTPDPNRPWESHYTTSQSVLRMADGSYRMWYATRKKPPFENKYFSICTATWGGLPSDQEGYRRKQRETRDKLRDMLGIPKTRVELNPESRGRIERDDIAIEKWVFTSEMGSRVTTLLYRPRNPGTAKMPAVVLTYGHGGSKSFWAYQYAGQLYAKLGVACLAMDPLGEEERNQHGKRGTRAHDRRENDTRAHAAGRPMLGKLVFDATRGIDYLLTRDDIDPSRIGVAGNSLGGTVAQFTAATDTRLRLTLVSGWMYDPINVNKGKLCTRTPSQRAAEICGWDEMLALSAPHSALLILNGTADTIIERRPPVGDEPGGMAWSGNHAAVAKAKHAYARLGADPSWVDHWYQEEGGHRGYFLTRTAIEWIHRHLGTPQMTLSQIRALPTINSGRWCDTNNVTLEGLYGTELHQRGLEMLDVGIRVFTDGELAVLKSTEQGRPEYTLAGWLDQIE